MGHKHTVSVELATRAVVRLEALPAEVQQAMQRQILGMAKTLQKQMRDNPVPNPTVLPRLIQLKQGRDRVYRVLFAVHGADHYITFRWPKRAPIDLEDRTRSVLLVLSLGNWEARFRAWCAKRQRDYD